jgi:hypothetical protein
MKRNQKQWTVWVFIIFSGIFAKILKNFNILWNAKATGVDTTKHSIKTCPDFLINIDKL